MTCRDAVARMPCSASALPWCWRMRACPPNLSARRFFGAVRPLGEVALDSSDVLEKAPFIVARAAAYGCDALVCPVSFATAPEAKLAAERAHVDLIGVGRLEQAIEFAKDAVQLHELVMTL